jgi:hypothetical protein
MKQVIRLIILTVFVGFTHYLFANEPTEKAIYTANAAVEGAWSFSDGEIEHTILLIDGYFVHSTYKLKAQEFLGTRGGPYSWDNGKISVIWQFDTYKVQQEADPATWIGQTATFDLQVVDAGTIASNLTGSKREWKQIDKNGGAISGVWRMTGRKVDDNISSTPLRERRTLKILTGTRFQWVAINIKTGQFSGTGGGRYTFENGKYTEHIEFFSRDNSRVGMSLEFNGEVKDGSWHHSGLSSTGNPIYEIWGKLENKF